MVITYILCSSLTILIPAFLWYMFDWLDDEDKLPKCIDNLVNGYYDYAAHFIIFLLFIICGAVSSYYVTVHPYRTDDVQVNIAKIPDNPTIYFKYQPKRNEFLYYEQTKEGIESREIDEYIGSTTIHEHYTLDKNETPYLTYKKNYNLLGIATYISDMHVYLPKLE